MSGGFHLDEKAFDLNDWVLLICIAVTYGMICIMPKRFSVSVTFLLFLFSSTAACMLDNSIGGHIFDLYDIMDGPAYTIMDFFVYLLYAPFGYFFIYFYDRFQLRGMKTIVYIAISSLLGVIFEWGCSLAGMFHYKDSYSLGYSFCIYLVSQTGAVLFYRYIASERMPAAGQSSERP